MSITTPELQARLEKGERPMIIDVREPEEYAMGHIPGAILKPLGRIHSWAHELDRECEEILLVCRSGNRSGMAEAFLRQLGFQNVKNVLGGMLTWQGPVE